MASGASLPRTPIEWYVFGAVLVVANVVWLIATGHPLPSALAMGTVVGLTMALVVVIAVVGWQALRGGGAPDGPDVE